MDDQTRLLEEQKALEIDEMFASPLALNQQNEAVNTSTANWFAQWSTLVRARILSIYFISSIIAYISMFIYYPCMTLINAQFSPNVEVMAFTAYGNLLLWAIGMPVWGSLSDRFSRKWVQAGLFVAVAVICFAICFSWKMWVFVVLYSLLGFFASGIPGVGMRVLFEILPPSKRGVAVGIFLTGTITAVIIGPFIAGGIAYIADWQLCYLLLSLFVITMLIVHLLLVPETLNEKKKVFNIPCVPLFRLLHSKEFIAVSLLIGLSSAFLFSIYLVIGSYFPNHYSLNSFEVGTIYLIVGILLAIGVLIGEILAYLLNKKFEIAGRILIPIVVLFILGFGSMTLGWTLGNTEKQYIPLIVILTCSFLRGTILPGLITYCIELQPKSAANIVEGLTVIQFLAAAVFQMLGTVIGVLEDYPLAFVSLGLLLLISGVPVTIIALKRLYERD